MGYKDGDRLFRNKTQPSDFSSFVSKIFEKNAHKHVTAKDLRSINLTSYSNNGQHTEEELNITANMKAHSRKLQGQYRKIIKDKNEPVHNPSHPSIPSTNHSTNPSIISSSLIPSSTTSSILSLLILLVLRLFLLLFLLLLLVLLLLLLLICLTICFKNLWVNYMIICMTSYIIILSLRFWLHYQIKTRLFLKTTK